MITIEFEWLIKISSKLYVGVRSFASNQNAVPKVRRRPTVIPSGAVILPAGDPEKRCRRCSLGGASNTVIAFVVSSAWLPICLIIPCRLSTEESLCLRINGHAVPTVETINFWRNCKRFPMTASNVIFGCQSLISPPQARRKLAQSRAESTLLAMRSNGDWVRLKLEISRSAQLIWQYQLILSCIRGSDGGVFLSRPLFSGSRT